MKFYHLFVVFIIAVVVSGCGQVQQQSQKQQIVNQDNSGSGGDLAGSSGSKVVVKEFALTAEKWDFSPSTITVNKGDRVEFMIQSIDVAHGIKIDAFDVNSRLEPGQTTTVEFVADKAGTFSFYCNVFCDDGHSGMKGTLVVQ